MTLNIGSLQYHLIPALAELRRHAVETEEEFASLIDRAHPNHRDSARNLAHYLALRRSDVRELQDELHYLGLSSLGRSESCVMSTLDNVIATLKCLAGEEYSAEEMVTTTVNARTGPMYLSDHARTLMGSPNGARSARIMVTMSSEAATDPSHLLELVRSGMDIMRINTAHDNADAWRAMISNLRLAERETGRKCKVYIDLGGPKFRIGPMERVRVRKGDIIRFAKGLHGYACDLRSPSEEKILLSCEPEAVFDAVRVGDPLWINDGKVSSRVIDVYDGGFEVEIVRTKHGGAWLRAEKGINLPNTPLQIDALTNDDVDHLEQLGPYADIIGMSFVRSARDVASLFTEMERLGLTDRGVVAKIETQDGFEHLPQILFEGLRHPPFGVMVARGDLAVEIGFERLAEVQEEILWLCEAAHVPVIWATQVLEGMAQKGIPSRAEVSDAAMSVRAECVMLNKGPYIINTVQFLSDILHRMAEHHSKKRSLLRKLSVSGVAAKQINGVL